MQERVISDSNFVVNTTTSELKLLTIFLYYALAVPLLRFFAGTNFLATQPLKGIIAFTPFVITFLWFVVRISPGKRYGPSRVFRITPLAIFLFGFIVVLAHAYSLGVQSGNYHLLGDIAGWVTLLSLSIISYHAVQSVNDVIVLFKRVLPFLILLAVLQFLSTFMLFAGINLFGFPSWTDTLLLFLGLSWFFSHFIMAFSSQSKDLRISLLFIGAVLVQFSKPMLWSLLVCAGAITIIGIRINRFSRIMKLTVIMTVAGLLLFLSLDVFFETYLNTSLIDQYTNQFELRFLKLNPDTGAQGELDGGRINIWDQALEIFQEEPWIGHGLGFGIVVNPSFPPIAIHNVVIYTLTTMGIPGFIFGIAVFLTWFGSVLKMFRSLQNMSLKLSLFGYIVSIFAFSMVGTMWVTISSMIFLGTAMGALLKIHTIESQTNYGS